jgi:hypothetical protein
VGLAWMGFRAPGVALLLFGAAGAVTAWAVLAAGALGLYGPVGLAVHRRGVLVLAAGLVVLPLASGNVSHAELDVPCVVVAAVLLRIGLVRWDGLGEPDRTLASPAPAAAGVRAAAVAATGPTGAPGRQRPSGGAAEGRPGAARVAGQLTGRAGTVLGREAASVLPRAARAAGRALGRARHEPPKR